MNVPKGSYPIAGYPSPRRFRATGEFRAPRAGEWYLSGAIVEAYRAPHDSGLPQYIAREVQL